MKRPAVLFDMDGTLADVSAIRHLVIPAPGDRRKDFDAFHRASVDCPPHAWVVEAARTAKGQGFDVLIVTARKAKWRHHTAWWLALNGVPSDALFMRPDHDNRPDREVKTDILRAIRRTWTPVLAYDDNPKIVTLWESHGITTVEVPGWHTTETEKR